MNNKYNIEINDTLDKVKTLRINNVFLHSKYRPLKEAAEFIFQNTLYYKNKKIVIIYGLGLGYHIAELLKVIDRNTIVYVFDFHDEIIKYCDKYGVLKQLKKDERIKLCLGYTKHNMLHFSETLKLVEDILIYKPSVKVLSTEYEDIKDSLNRLIISKKAYEKFHDIMIENESYNEKILCDDIKDFVNDGRYFNHPIILAAAGPSLDENVEVIKSINKNVSIFAVGSAVRTLVENNIIPDMICIIDSQEIVYNQLRGYENLNVPLCFLSTASRWAVKNYKGPKFKFYNYNKENNIIINTGKSVATAILDIAIKIGANPIIFIGQDLAFLNNKTHTNSYDIIYGEEDLINSDLICKEVLGVDGKKLKTSSGLLYFKYWIENRIKEETDVTFINCSKGAKIEGTIELPLEEVINSYY